MKTLVYAKFQFEGFHSWPGAADIPEVSFLAARHRHMFHVRLAVEVSHADRDVEFITLKKSAEEWCNKMAKQNAVAHWSCEAWAQALVTEFRASFADVSEDGENGAIVWS